MAETHKSGGASVWFFSLVDYRNVELGLIGIIYDRLGAYFDFCVDGGKPCRLPAHRPAVVLLDASLSTDDNCPYALFFRHCDLSEGEGQSHIGSRK